MPLPADRPSEPPFFRKRCIPGGQTIEGDLDLRGSPSLHRIEDGVRITGSFWLGGIEPEGEGRARKEPGVANSARCHLTALPEHLAIDQDFHFHACAQVTHLPPTMRVGGSLSLCGLPRLKEFPPGIFHGRRLHITGCPQLVQLPAGMNPLEQLVIDGAGIEALPDDIQMTAGAELILQNCVRLRALPAALVGSGVLGRIIIRNCPQLDFLPDLIASSAIVVERLRIKEFGFRFQAPRVRISHCADLSALIGPLKATDLTISQCPVLTRLPSPEGVLTSLSLWGCRSLPELPSPLRFIPGKRVARLNLVGCAALTGLPEITIEREGKMIALEVEISGSALRSAPDYPFEWRVKIRGAWAPPRFVFHPESIEPAEILLHPNAEVRRVLIERAGIADLLARTQHVIVDEDSDAGGPRRLIRFWLPLPKWLASRAGSRPSGAILLGRTIMRLILAPFKPRRAQPSPSPQPASNPVPAPPPVGAAFLQCRCPTTAREYLLPVPPAILTCRAAAAWMAGFDHPDDYQPVLET